MRVSGIAREYSTLLFPALDIALNYSLISLFTALSLVIACYQSLPLFRLPSLVIALHRLLSPAIHFYRLPSPAIALHRLPSLVIALYRLSSFFTACHLDS
jgi:hypothetical protein